MKNTILQSSQKQDKVFNIASVLQANEAYLFRQIDRKLASVQKCKTSRNIIIHCVMWRAAIPENTSFETHGTLEVLLGSGDGLAWVWLNSHSITSYFN